MFDEINIHSRVAAYVQIENQILFAVVSGRLKPGEKLPGIRELGERLKTNFNTVTKSYQDLDAMGVVYARRGSGVFINKGVEAKCRENCRRRIIARLYEAVAEAKAAGMTPQDVKGIVGKSYAVAGNPYADAPAEVLALA